MVTLKLDVDRPGCPRLGRLFWILRLMRLRPVLVEYGRTARGWHVTVTARGHLTPVATVAAQAVMGSDRNREVFNLVRALIWPAGFHRWGNVLFDRKVPLFDTQTYTAEAAGGLSPAHLTRGR